MKRVAVNPTDWGLQWSMNQGGIVEGSTRVLHCSGQVTPPQSLLGVSRLVLPELLVEIEATAAD